MAVCQEGSGRRGRGGSAHGFAALKFEALLGAGREMGGGALLF